MSEAVGEASRPVFSTGIDGLDDILAGGFSRKRLFLVEGVPGSGKTTLALQFLMAARRPWRAGALRHAVGNRRGAALGGRTRTAGRSTASTIRELTPPEADLEPDEQNTMFHPSEVELGVTTQAILADVERLKPTRVVFDSLSELRLLAGTRAALPPADSRTEAVLRDAGVHGPPARRHDRHRSRPADAEHRARRGAAGAAQPEYGAERRRLRVVKYRGVHVPRRLSRLRHPEGRHRGVPAARRGRAPAARARTRSCPAASPSSTRCSAAASRRGRARSCVGAAGTGKSTLAAQFAAAAAERGEPAAPCSSSTRARRRCSPAATRSRSTLRTHLEAGRVAMQPGRSGRADARELIARDPRGRRAARREDRRHRQPERLSECDAGGAVPDHPAARTADVSRPEGRRHHPDRRPSGLIGAQMHTPVDASYLADAVVLLRYFEAQGRGPAGDLGHQEARRRARAHASASSAWTDGDHRRRGAARLPRHSHRRAGLRRRPRPAANDAGSRDHTGRHAGTRGRARPRRSPPTHEGRRAHADALLGDAGIAVEICADVRRARRRNCGRVPARCWWPKRRCRRRSTAALGRALAAQPPWSDLPVLVLAAARRRLRRGRRRGAIARQRDAARAPGARHHAAERRADRAARPRAAVPDPRAPRRSRARRRIAAAGRPAQGRVPGDARTRAAQSARAAPDWPRSS